MTSKLKWWLALVLVIVFLAGTATGFFGAAHYARRMFWERHSDHAGERMRAHLQRDLDLTPEQNAKIDPIIKQMSERLEAIRKETGHRVFETMNQAHQEMLPLLTPEQREKAQKIREHHERMRLQMQHGEPPPPPPPP